MSKENYNALQIVPNFSFGIEEWNLFDAADNTTPDEDLINYLDGEVNVGNDHEAIPNHAAEVQEFLHESVAKSTIYKDVSAENRFRKFMYSVNPTDIRQIRQIAPLELDVIMSKFFMTKSTKIVLKGWENSTNPTV